MSTHDAPHDDTLATEVSDRDPADETTPLAAQPAPSAQSAPAQPQATAPPERPYLRGPAPFAIVLGVLGLLVAGSVLLGELGNLTVNVDNLGPWTVVAAGILVLVVGTLGVRASRPRD